MHFPFYIRYLLAHDITKISIRYFPVIMNNFSTPQWEPAIKKWWYDVTCKHFSYPNTGRFKFILRFVDLSRFYPDPPRFPIPTWLLIINSHQISLGSVQLLKLSPIIILCGTIEEGGSGYYEGLLVQTLEQAL